nr:MAG TPA: hypothetical protein [Caudoviricetes sp.]
MAWLIRNMAGRYYLSTRHPISMDDIDCSCDWKELSNDLAVMLLNGAELEPGKFKYIATTYQSKCVPKPGWYAADEDGKIHWFEFKPVYINSKWKARYGHSEPASIDMLCGVLSKIPEPTDSKPVQYTVVHEQFSSISAVDVLPVKASEQLLKIGLKPRKSLGHICNYRYPNADILTVLPSDSFTRQKKFIYTPAFTFEDLVQEVLNNNNLSITKDGSNYELRVGENFVITGDSLTKVFFEAVIKLTTFFNSKM